MIVSLFGKTPFRLRTFADDGCRRQLVPEGGEWLGLDKPQELLLLDLAPMRAALL
jgi:hypothetical protein